MKKWISQVEVEVVVEDFLEEEVNKDHFAATIKITAMNQIVEEVKISGVSLSKIRMTRETSDFH